MPILKNLQALLVIPQILQHKAYEKKRYRETKKN